MQTKQLIFSLIAITAILFVSCSERQSATGTEVSGTQIFTLAWLQREMYKHVPLRLR